MKLIANCSSNKFLMTNSRSKSDPLSQTTKTWLQLKAKEAFYGFKSDFSSKHTEKGNMCEEDAITMLSEAHFETYQKNPKRFNNGWLTGEPDIITDTSIRDIKCPWSLETFPAFVEDAEKEIKKAGYDWQLRGYMMLCDKDEAFIDYCMMSTPFELVKEWDNLDIHHVEHIDPVKRITSVRIERDLEIEKQMKERYDIANEYFIKLMEELEAK